MKRIFAAIKIHPTKLFRNTYFQLKSNLKDEKIKWVELENIHITLKFFGETDERKIGSINELLAKIADNHSSFSLNINDIRIFGSSYKPRVIWFGIEKSEQLISLAYDVLDQVQGLGFVRDRQNFVPHLTIGRIKFIEDKKRFQEVISRFESIKIQDQKVDQFYLIESILRPQGPEYKILESFHLQ
ncbi:MAG: RNA 2',3'-cyclic phosphodiesterase [Bacteroidales bacterium]|nr:RNA 2',3'-cyclic phosphodiesterase [Bacteroidales bacterium]